MSAATMHGKYFLCFPLIWLSEYELDTVFIVQVALRFSFLFIDYIIYNIDFL
jgi:hypothetical protein